jgi:WD40 repeat protein
VPSRRQLGTALKPHAGSVYSVAFSPDGRTLAAGSANGTVLWWDVRTHAELATRSDHAIGTVAFSPNGDILASGDIDGTVVLWDARNQHPHGTPLKSHIGLVNSVAFSPDGRTLAIGSGDHGTVALWNVQSQSRIGTLLTGNGNAVPVFSVAFSPDGRYLAAGGFDGTIRVWETVL